MEEPIVLQLFLIGFHHKQGWIKDIEFPKSAIIDAADLEHLPSLCLPDLSHNFESDSVYFVLPSSKNDKGEEKIFGVSCYRQIAIEKLANRSENDEFSRSSVVKAVCCLARLPLFGYIEVKLNIIVDKIFESGNFDCDVLLEESYHELNRCLSLRIQRCYDDSELISFNDDFINDFYIGTFLREILTQWRHKALVLFKLFLLEKRILFFGSPVLPLCTTILSILSLHPQILNLGLCNYFQKSSNVTTFQQHESDPSPVSDLKICQSSDVKTPDNESIRSEDIDSLKQITILPTIPASEYHAPMQIFRNGSLCLPFISLQYIDTIMDKTLNGFIVGASNILFMHKKNLFDVVIDVTNQTFDVIDPDLKKCLSLSTEDLRFVEHLIKGVESPRANGYGTDCWIREQFESYFTSMLRTLYDSDTNQRDLEAFNDHYMELWKKTNNYQDWLAKKITASTTFSRDEISAFDTFPRGHLFTKTGNTINVGDFRNKIVQSLNNTQSARKINQAVNSTISNAKSSISSWLSNFSQKDEVAQDVVLSLNDQVATKDRSSDATSDEFDEK